MRSRLGGKRHGSPVRLYTFISRRKTRYRVVDLTRVSVMSACPSQVSKKLVQGVELLLIIHWHWQSYV